MVSVLTELQTISALGFQRKGELNEGGCEMFLNHWSHELECDERVGCGQRHDDRGQTSRQPQGWRVHEPPSCGSRGNPACLNPREMLLGEASGHVLLGPEAPGI